MEITQSNFEERFQEIAYNLKQANFIGFDAEFTAILSGECFKHRLFDTNQERYDRIKTEVSKMIMTQVGLTTFQYSRTTDAYIAKGFTFHLCPQAFGDIDQAFVFQASTLNFLCRHKFNFNKFIYEGLPFLSKAEEISVRQQLKDNCLFDNILQSLDMHDERILQQHCSEVAGWLGQSEDETMYIDMENPIMRYLIHMEIRTRFPGVLTTDSLGNSKKMLLFRNKNIEGAVSASVSELEEQLMNHILGFSRIISLLEEYRKPIVGHNIFLDVILLHNQFIGPLPKKYSTFKKNVNAVFPEVYDTKYISHEMARKLTFDEVWKSNALKDLYEFFLTKKCRILQSGVNLIRLETPFDVTQSYHEAGWDSYCSGYCFIRLGQWVACENRGQYRPVGPTENLAALSPYRNRVNIIRGAVKYMSLVGDDPPRSRPNLLYARSMKERVVDVGKLTSALAIFGSVDVKSCNSRGALIAAGSQFTADKILKQFKESQEYSISKYSSYRHSTVGRVAMWSSAIFTGSLLIYLLHKKVKS